MMHAYPETYLNDAMNNLGNMFDYGLVDLHYDPERFYEQFLTSGVAKQFEQGNPKYVAGLSGPELAIEVIYRTEDHRPTQMPSEEIDKSPEYWAGWSLAYYQWYRAHRFSYLQQYGLTIQRILSMYPTLHEADLSKFVTVADGIIAKEKSAQISNLQRMRKNCGMTQKELAEKSGTSLRMVQVYEQRKQDIRKAEAQTLVNLSRVLGCGVEDLFD